LSATSGPFELLDLLSSVQYCHKRPLLSLFRHYSPTFICGLNLQRTKQPQAGPAVAHQPSRLGVPPCSHVSWLPGLAWAECVSQLCVMLSLGILMVLLLVNPVDQSLAMNHESRIRSCLKCANRVLKVVMGISHCRCTLCLEAIALPPSRPPVWLYGHSTECQMCFPR
jgi:hypothetical protein